MLFNLICLNEGSGAKTFYIKEICEDYDCFISGLQWLEGRICIYVNI